MAAVSILGEAEARIPGEVVDGEQQPDTELTLVMNNRAWILVEDLTGESYRDTLAYLLSCSELLNPDTGEVVRAGREVKLGVMRTILFAATRDHHPELSIDDCGEMVIEHRGLVTDPLNVAILRSLKLKTDAPGNGKPKAKPAKPKRGNGTGTRSSPSTSKPAAPLPPS